MRKVELAEGIFSSALGFGCASILGSVDERKAKRALSCALEYGINHFDLARSYGYGEAEKFVGKVIQGKRTEIVLSSKFGIRANWKAKLFKPVKPVLRLAFKTVKGSTNQSKPMASSGFAEKLHERVKIDRLEMVKSLEESLRALKTDYLDFFFIHEPKETIADYEELAEAAEKLKKVGKIRAWGLSFLKSEKLIHEAYIDTFDVLQFDNSPGSMNYQKWVLERGDKSNVIFSPLRGGGTELSPAQKLAKLSLDFPKSVILCSMFNEKHLRENISIF